MKHLSFLVLCNAWHQQAMHVIGGLVHSHPCHIDNGWEFSCHASDAAFRAPAVTYWPWHALAVLLINSYLRTDAHPEIEFNFAHSSLLNPKLHHNPQGGFQSCYKLRPLVQLNFSTDRLLLKALRKYE